MPSPSSSPFTDRSTLVLGGSYMMLGAVLGSLGPVSDQLRDELGLSGTVTGLYGSMFGWALFAAALGAGSLRRRIGDVALFFGGLVIVVGALAVLTAASVVAISLVGVAAIGIGATALVLSVPSMVAAQHRDTDRRAAAFTLVNALSQAGTVVAPLVIATGLRLGWGWRLPWVLFVVLIAGVTALAASGTNFPRLPPEHVVPIGPFAVIRRSRRVLRDLCVLALGVGVEFSALLWGSTTIQRLGGASAAVGAVGVGLFGVGMLLGRLFGPGLTRGWDRSVVLRTAFAGTIVSTIMLRVGPGAGIRVVALGATGLFLSLVYPYAFHRLYGPDVSDSEVTTLGAFASGVAITVPAPLLGALADNFGLKWAIFIAPAMAAVALVLLSSSGDRTLSPDPALETANC